jgi:hypothetical protein
MRNGNTLEVTESEGDVMYTIIVWADKNDPFSEITAYGPFNEETSARLWANQNFGVYWRLAKTVRPTLEVAEPESPVRLLISYRWVN